MTRTYMRRDDSQLLRGQCRATGSVSMKEMGRSLEMKAPESGSSTPENTSACASAHSDPQHSDPSCANITCSGH